MTQPTPFSEEGAMDGEDYRILWLSLICALTCLVGIAVGLHLLVKNAIATITARASHKQLLLDAENLRLGRPLRAIGGDPGGANRKLIAAALNRV